MEEAFIQVTIILVNYLCSNMVYRRKLNYGDEATLTLGLYDNQLAGFFGLFI